MPEGLGLIEQGSLVGFHPDIKLFEGFPGVDDKPRFSSKGDGREPAPPALGHLFLQQDEEAPSALSRDIPPGGDTSDSLNNVPDLSDIILGDDPLIDFRELEPSWPNVLPELFDFVRHLY
jgi:hypothetical protein